MHQDGIIKQARVLIVDDLLATGGTAEAAVRLVRMVGGNVIGCAFVVELDGLKGRERLAPLNCFSLIHYD
jgi:adenine phosphoribosyltransferase